MAVINSDKSYDAYVKLKNCLNTSIVVVST